MGSPKSPTPAQLQELEKASELVEESVAITSGGSSEAGCAGLALELPALGGSAAVVDFPLAPRATSGW